ncbi:MAG: ABC transporter permease [Tuberibacillus sp.]
MFNFIRLVQNENMKLFRKTSTVIMFILLFVFMICAGTVSKFNAQDPPADWKQSLTQQTTEMKAQLQQSAGRDTDSLKASIALNEYRLDHNVAPLESKSIWGFTNNANDMMMFVMVFSIIVAGGIVSSEFNSGTIKLLLTRPVKRATILLSKYVSTLFAAVIFTGTAFIISWLVGGIFFGFTDLSHPYLSFVDGTVRESSMLAHILVNYGFDFIQLIIMATIAFMISSLFRNSALAIGLSIFAMMAGPLVIQFLAGYDWVKFILFSNLDLSVYFDGNTPPFDGMTLGFSSTILFIYYIIFVGVTWLFFIRRDVTA